MTNIVHKNLLAISIVLLLVLAGATTGAAKSRKGMASFSIGYRFESGTLENGITGSVTVDSRLYKGILLFGAMDLQTVLTGGWRSSSSSVGVGGWVGLKLRVRPRNPGFKLSPGIAIGSLVLPSGVFGRGQFATVRLSLDMAIIPQEGGGLLLEASALHFISEIESWDNTRRSLDPLISLRIGWIIRSF